MKKLKREECTFSFSRSSGAGGQNVNKVNSKATLYWDLKTTTLPIDVLERFRERYHGFITQDDIVQITSQETRNQKDNVEDCFDRLNRMLENVWRAPKKRKATRPTRSSVEKRIKSKKMSGEKKRLRRSVD
ncbi:MAG: aminoacyl-tRNA hydrolase [Bacteriovoracaceae bacterium]|nr:aminoacyl-tRNA hydrolase [Bacteriovoracaceae bacterium]